MPAWAILYTNDGSPPLSLRQDRALTTAASSTVLPSSEVLNQRPTSGDPPCTTAKKSAETGASVSGIGSLSTITAAADVSAYLMAANA